MNKKTFIIIVVFLTMLTENAIAVNIKIDGIYYSLKKTEKIAQVIEPNDNSSYSGDIIIPDKVLYDHKEYKVTLISMTAFRCCQSITSIIIGNNVQGIPYKAFNECSNLSSVAIGNSVTTIEDCAFAECKSLCSVNIPSSVTSIGNSAFYGCKSLTSINIPNSVTEIGSLAFYLCTKLATITISNGVSTIKENTFAECHALTSVVIGKNVSTIEDKAFDSTRPKKIIWLTNSMPKGTGSVRGEWINFVPNEQFKFINQVIYPFLSSYFDVDGVRYVPLSTTDNTCDAIDCINDESISNIIIPSSVTYGDKVMTVKNIQKFFGYGNNYIMNLTVNNNGELSNEAFSGCSNLQNVTIGRNVNYIGNKAFYNCNNLKSVNVSDISAWCNIQFGDNDGDSDANPLYFARRLYLNGTEVNNLEIPNNVSSIKNYAFHNCTSITSVSIPNSVNSIGKEAFCKCEKLVSFTIGSGVESISVSSFAECPELKEVFCYAENVPNANSDAFNNSNIEDVTLYVSENSVNAYNAIEPWNNFYTIKTIKPKYYLTYVINGDIYKIYQVEEGKIVIPEPDPIWVGYTFSGWNSIPKTMPANNVEVTGSFAKDIMRGDVNRDNKVDAMDINDIVQYIMGMPSSRFDENVANVNNDNKVNIADIVEIVNNILNEDPGGTPVDVNLEVSSTSLSFDSSGNSGQLFVTCNDSWTASSDQSWCTVSPASNTNNGRLTIAVTENPSTLIRSATLTVEAGAKIKTVIVVQKGADMTPIGVMAVDLGLPSGTLWANMNVGASKPEDYGNYFAWGETFPKSQYDWSTYKYCEGNENKLTKYCTNSEYGSCDNKRVLDAYDDAANVNWSSNWHIPSREQYEELINCTNYEWTDLNGVNGYKFTSKTNGNYIFLPAAGSHSNKNYSVGEDGYYWSSEIHNGKPSCSWKLGFTSKMVLSSVSSDRYKGHSVRPVRKK